MTQRYFIIAIFAVISGCGGGVSEDLEVAPRQFAASAANTTLTVLDGQMLPARSHTLRYTDSNGELQVVDIASSYGYDPVSEIIEVSVGNTSRSLDVSGANPNGRIEEYFVEFTGEEFTVFRVWFDALNEYGNGIADLKYVIPFHSYVGDDDDLFVDRDYGVFGFETPSTVLQQGTIQASYSGGFMIDNWGPFDFNANRYRMLGDLTMDVDFATARIIDGALAVTLTLPEDSGSVTPTGGFIIGSTQIDTSENSFSANLQTTLPGLTLRSGAVLTGGFYGDAAQEVGGSIAYTGTLDGTDVIAGGVFAADMD